MTGLKESDLPREASKKPMKSRRGKTKTNNAKAGIMEKVFKRMPQSEYMRLKYGSWTLPKKLIVKPRDMQATKALDEKERIQGGEFVVERKMRRRHYSEGNG